MNGWFTIKQVRKRMNKAQRFAKDGNHKAASTCMCEAISLLTNYWKESHAPKYGFEAEILGS